MTDKENDFIRRLYLSIMTDNKRRAGMLDENSIVSVYKLPVCHPELVSGSHNPLKLRDAEINSA
jgi:hypothetical protein